MSMSPLRLLSSKREGLHHHELPVSEIQSSPMTQEPVTPLERFLEMLPGSLGDDRDILAALHDLLEAEAVEAARDHDARIAREAVDRAFAAVIEVGVAEIATASDGHPSTRFMGAAEIVDKARVLLATESTQQEGGT